jgi:HD domain
MTETQVLLTKIGALRQRLDQVHGLASEARAAAEDLLSSRRFQALAERIAAGDESDSALDGAVRPLDGSREDHPGPYHLSSRARRILERGENLLVQVRDLADDFAPDSPEITAGAILAPFYRGTLAMIDTALRTVSLLPDSIAKQMHLCAGLEETLEVVSERLRILLETRARHRDERDRVARLAELFRALAAGRTLDVGLFRQMAENVLAEAAACEPLRFPETPPPDPAHFAACHGLTVARVAARLVGQDTTLRDRAADVVLAALLHDVGMVRVPIEILITTGSLGDDERRVVEGHTRHGGEILAPLMPNQNWLCDVAAHHHERLDGTGYPDGWKAGRLEPMTRLVAVCDVYAALCSGRSYRPQRSSRTALADTLLQAERGELDARCAELLLPLSFYPVGTMVELAHGERGVVVATPTTGPSLDAPSRPVVALLTDAGGQSLPKARHVDLAKSEHRIARSLTPAERRAMVAQFPQWA